MAPEYKVRIARGPKARLPQPPNSFEQGRPYFCTNTGELFIGTGLTTAMEQVKGFGDVGLQAEIDAEIARAEAAEATKADITYVDTQDAATLSSAKAYTDAAVAGEDDSAFALESNLTAEVSRAEAAEAAAVTTAEAYTDTAISGEVTRADGAYLKLTGGTLSGEFQSSVWNGTIAQFHDDDGRVTWNLVGGSFPNSFGDTRNNQVFRLGWNLANGGGPLVPGEPCLGIEMEDYYVASAPQVGTGQMEFHIAYVDTTATVHRPFSFSADRSSNFVDMGWNADKLSFVRRSDNVQIGVWLLGAGGPQLSLEQGCTLLGESTVPAQTWSINSATGTADFTGSLTVGTAGATSSLEIDGLSTQGPDLIRCTTEAGVKFEVAPGGGVTFYADANMQSNNLIFGSGQTLRIQPSSIAMYSSGYIYWSGDTHAYDAQDTGISRSAAGVVSVDTTARGNAAGSLVCTNATISGHIVAPLTVHGTVVDFQVDSAGGVHFSYLGAGVNVNGQPLTNMGVLQLNDNVGNYAYVKADAGSGNISALKLASKADGSGAGELRVYNGTAYASLEHNGSNLVLHATTGHIYCTESCETGGLFILGGDTGISRTAADTVAVGNGTQGDASGAIKAADFVRAGSPKYAGFLDDFLIGPYGWGNFNVGSPSGGQAWYITDAANADHPGILRINTGTASGAGMGFWNGNFGPGPGYPNWTLESYVEVSSLTGGICFGFFASQTWATTNGACYFIYDSNVNGNWHIQTPNNNYDTGVAAAANTWVKQTFVSDGTNVYAYLNGTLVKTMTISTEGFGASADRYGGMCITRSGSAEFGDWDYILYQRGPLNR